MRALPGHLIRPPIRPATEKVVDLAPGTPLVDAFRLIGEGKTLCLTGTWGSAMALYSRLKRRIAAEHPIHDYADARRHQDAWHTCHTRVVVRIERYRPVLAKAPHNPWLEAFFPNRPRFFMAFADFLGLNGAWQWYRKGIRYPMLPHSIHPFYGTYFPTRHDHLLLLDRWLKGVGGNRYRRAVDIGTGCGVLAFILRARGLAPIHATDINPNAIYSLEQDLKRLGPKFGRDIVPEQADMLGTFRPGGEDLVLFNPPWLPGEPAKPMDQACYYHPGFFDDFFDRMGGQCASGTTLGILFSDFARAAGVVQEHPVLEALEKYGSLFTLVDHLREPVRQPPAKATAWLTEIRRREKVELLVMRRTDGPV